MNKNIIPTKVESIVYFDSKFNSIIDLSPELKKCIQRLKYNDINVKYVIIDSSTSWVSEQYYQYRIKLYIEIMPFIDIPNYYQNGYKNLNYQFTKINFDKFWKYFLILMFTTNNFIPFYYEDTKLNIDNDNCNIDDSYIHSENLAICDRKYLYEQLMSTKVVNQLSKLYDKNNIEYEPYVEELINKYSIELSKYIVKNNLISDNRKILVL